MNFKLTVRRRNDDGSLETATYKLEHVHSSGDDEEQSKLLVDLESQANDSMGSTLSDKNSVRVWVEEDI